MFTACALGALIGAAYTLSPAGVLSLVAIAGLVVWARRGLDGRERRWVTGVLLAAVSVRILAIVGFFLLTRSESGAFTALIPDETYVLVRARWLRSIAMSVPLAAAEYAESRQAYGDTSVNYLLAYLQILIGESPYGIRLVNTTLYIATAVILHRVARAAFGPVAALAGLTVTLFIPTLFVWSISALKEPIYYFLTAASLGAAWAAVRLPRWRARLAMVAVAAASAWMLGTLRTGGGAMTGGGILGGLFLAVGLQRRRLLAAAVVCGILFATVALFSPAIQNRAAAAMAFAASLHIGHVHTQGYHYKLLDTEFYTRKEGYFRGIVPDDMTPGRSVRYVLRAAASFVLVPAPWDVESRSALAHVPEQIVWYLLVALAAVGTVAGLRRDPVLTLMLAGVILLSGSGIALSSGNIGTLVRHRGMVFVLVPWLSAVGAAALLGALAARVSSAGAPLSLPREMVRTHAAS